MRLAIVSVLALAFSGVSFGQSYIISVGGLTSITETTATALPAGYSFAVDAFFDPQVPYTGITKFFSEIGGTGLFAISSRIISPSNPMDSPLLTNVTSLPAALLDPRNDNDLGYSEDDVFADITPSLVLLHTLVITAQQPIPFGTYRFQATGSLTNSSFDDILVAPSNILTLNVIPEPATLALLGLGGLVALRRRK